MLCTKIVVCFCLDIQNNLCTQHVLNMLWASDKDLPVLAAFDETVVSKIFHIFRWKLTQCNVGCFSKFGYSFVQYAFFNLAPPGSYIWNLKTLPQWTKMPDLIWKLVWHQIIGNSSIVVSFYQKSKVIYPKYSKHWPYTVAHTIECVFKGQLISKGNFGVFNSSKKQAWKL